MAESIIGPLQTTLNSAYQTIGSLFGTTFEWYNPFTNNNPISPLSDSGTFLCYFDRDPKFTAQKSHAFGKPEFFVAYSRMGPDVGDYLQSGSDTYFIVDQQQLTPSKVVQTNSVVDFYRPGATAPAPDLTDRKKYVEESAQGFGLMIAQQWPISLLSGSRGEKATIALPESGRMPWWNWLCPAIPGVRLRVDDKFKDENGFRYQISACELSDLGYRGTAQIAQG